MNLHGRVVQIETDAITIQNESGIHVYRPPSPPHPQIKINDIVEIRDEAVHALTRSEASTRKWTEHVLNPKRIHGLNTRDQVEAAIHAYFRSEGFRSVRTPLLVPCPGMEPHIRPMMVQTTPQHQAYLPTSPEFAMKRLLVGGLEKIYQICPSFRSEPWSSTHHPEFTMLEWYRAYEQLETAMTDVEKLFHQAALSLLGRPQIHYQDRNISLELPWPRFQVKDLFKEKVGIDLINDSLESQAKRLGIAATPQDTWDDIYFKIWMDRIEPALPMDRPCFVTHYPPSQAALAVIEKDKEGSPWAKRFEVYIAGFELANAFQELTDHKEQRKRFIEDMQLRTRIYGESFPPNPLDEGFLEALAEGMPPSVGVALGVDRMVMLFADETDIRNTLWLESDTPII